MNTEQSNNPSEQTKKCPKCGEQILATAKKCKHCQADLQNWFVRHKILTGIIILFVLIWGFGNSTANKKIDEAEQKVEAGEKALQEELDKVTESTIPTAEEMNYVINEDVLIDDLKIQIVKVTNLGNSVSRSYLEPITTQGSFIRVDFEVENMGNEAQYMGDMKIIDSKDREFSESNEKYSILGDDANFLDKLNPNVKTNYSTVFDIAPDAQGLKLKTNGFGLFNTNYVLIDLGI